MTDVLSLPAVLRDLIRTGSGPAVFLQDAERRPVDSLVLADSPRLAGENAEHVQRLAQIHGGLPPILVHRATMQVIDGWHRVRAAILRGEDDIEVRFFDGPENQVFVLAVGANSQHGLPLSLADRRAAAGRIIASYPVWSDRAVAATVGLAAGTVAGLRRKLGTSASTERIGRDGRARRLDAAQGRRIASEILAERPTASLREVAKEARISPATVRDVRLRMERGESNAEARSKAPAIRRVGGQVPVGGSRDFDAIMRGLRSDPSLRLTDSGRNFLRCFMPRVVGPRGLDDLVDGIPPHSKYAIAGLARKCADEWGRFAEELEQQARSTA